MEPNTPKPIIAPGSATPQLPPEPPPVVPASAVLKTAPPLKIEIETATTDNPAELNADTAVIQTAYSPVDDLVGDPVDDPIDDPIDDAADSLVDDIVASESDELLAARDAALQPASALPYQSPAVSKNLWQKLAQLPAAWWHNQLLRYGTGLILFAAVVALAALPTSRYYAMNTLGARSKASLTILDNTTQLPLKNVSIELGDRTAKTNLDGVVKLSSMKLGTQSLAIHQAGFATINKTITLGWGSNPLGDFTLDAVGTQFRIKLTDYLTGKPVTSAQISSGNANAQSDKAGQLIITIDKSESDIRSAVVSSSGYRDEAVSLDINKPGSQMVVMVPAEKEVYISKQTGRYDVYKIDIDGKNKQLLLAASGQENSDISLVAHTSGHEVALVSKRDTTHNQDGFPLQTLTLIDIDKGTTLTLDHSERIQIIDWTADQLVYIKVKAGTSAGNPERYQLISYNYQTTARLQLATANYFSDIIAAKGTIYYAASNNYQGGVSQFVKISPDNTGKVVLIDKLDIFNILRSSTDMLDLSSQQGNYQYKIGDDNAVKLPGAQTSLKETRFYIDAPDKKQALWTDSRDGKGVLLVSGGDTKKDSVLVTTAVQPYPVRWLNNRTIVYGVSSATETADYVISLDGGAAKKIVDRTNTAGIEQGGYR